jgi:hypothetical protein
MGEINKHEKTELPYYRLYTLLFDDVRYSLMHLESAVLYSMLLSRVSLSEKNGWQDETQRIFIYCTVDEACHFLRCGRDKAMKTLREMENLGLIIRRKQGRGKPDKIYVLPLQEVEKTDL